jgi:hypothetical protein
MNDVMADLASGAVDIMRYSIYHRLMVMLVSLDFVGQAPVMSLDLPRYPTTSSGP